MQHPVLCRVPQLPESEEDDYGTLPHCAGCGGYDLSAGGTVQVRNTIKGSKGSIKKNVKIRGAVIVYV